MDVRFVAVLPVAKNPWTNLDRHAIPVRNELKSAAVTEPQEGLVAGTPAFRSPEQSADATVNARSELPHRAASRWIGFGTPEPVILDSVGRLTAAEFHPFRVRYGLSN